TDYAAAGGRHADGTAAVGGLSDWHDARRYGCRRATARSASGHGRVPGVDCWTVEPWLGGDPPAIFRRVAAAEDDKARRPHPPHHFRIAVADEILEIAKPGSERRSFPHRT